MASAPYLYYEPNTVIVLQGDRYGICLPPADINREFEKEFGTLPGLIFGESSPSQCDRSAFWDKYVPAVSCVHVQGNIMCGRGNIWQQNNTDDMFVSKITENRLSINPNPVFSHTSAKLDYQPLPWRPMLVPLDKDGRFDLRPGRDNPTGEIVTGGSFLANGLVEKPGFLYECNGTISNRPDFVETEEGKELEWMWINGVLICTTILANVSTKQFFDWGYAICSAYPYFSL